MRNCLRSDDSILAAYWQRVIAAVIDKAILLIPCALAYQDGYYGAMSQQKDLAFIPLWYAGLVEMIMLYVPLSAVYYIGMTTKFGSTIGKRVMGLKVVKSSGDKVTCLDALYRWFFSPLSTLLLGYGYLRVLWDPKKQTLHDVIADTKVVQ